MHKIVILACIFLFFVPACTGIRLSDNCSSGKDITIAVLPFISDAYRCNKKIEKILAEKCYTIVDGEQLLNEFMLSTNKPLDSVSIQEFTQYAKSKNVDKIVTGNMKIIFEEGHRFSGNLLNQSDNTNNSITNRDVYDVVTGNYATVDCFIYDIKTSERSQIFKNYKVMKITRGNPNDFFNTNR